MQLPRLTYASGIKKGKQVAFKGLNHTLGADDGDIYSMTNMTSDHSPVLATRERRYLYRKLNNPGGLFAWNKLCWVDGEKFYYDGEEKGTVSPGQKSFASLGAYIVILPDKCYYNGETDTFGSMEAKWTGEKLTFTNGILYEEAADANAIYCEGVNWADFFKAGDAVTIAGCTQQAGNNKTIIIRDIREDYLYFYEYSFTLPDDKEYEETGELCISRTVPDIGMACENENRLWAMTGDTIYCTKQGDIFNWNVYDGLESDAWAVTPGDAGCFTGCISYKGFPIFSKEEKIYKVYGSLPSNFETMGSATLGVADGSGRSLAIAGETLFYLSRSGIMAYSGGIPMSVGAAFGTERFRDAVGGSDGLKYYVSMVGEDGERWLYVYDTQRHMWHREDRQNVLNFAYWDGNLYFLNDKGEIWIAGNVQDPPQTAQLEAVAAWEVEFADFVEDNPNKKGVSKLQLRMELESGAEFEALLQFDSDGVWHSVRKLIGEDPKRSWYLPIIPRRCDHYRLLLRGVGGFRLYSLVREFYGGSELRSGHRRN